MHITLTCGVGLVLCALDLAVAKAIGFIPAGSNLLLDGKSEFQRHRRNGVDEELADSGVNAGS